MTALPLQLERTAIGHINVSNPSFVVIRRPSHQSLTASEDYYSLSGSSTRSEDTIQPRNNSVHPIRRYSTPPSRYRTPLQSSDRLAPGSRDNLVTQNAVAVDNELTRTPLRGHGTRRQSSGSYVEPTVSGTGPSVPVTAVLRDGGVRRAPATNTPMDGYDSTEQDHFPGHAQARSSVARDIARDGSPPTPDDDTPYIRFALDQLTRDEEVRGSRRYPGINDDVAASREQRSPLLDTTKLDHEPEEAVTGLPYVSPDRALDQPATEQWPQPQRGFDEPTPRPQRQDGYQQEESDVADLFLPVMSRSRNQAPLNFFPGILRAPSFGLFVLVLLAYIGLLIASAILSLEQNGLFPYGDLGDGYYFLCQYLPSILGMALFLWLVQIEVALYRIAPFIALSSPSPAHRHEGARLPMFPASFFLPCLEHCYAGQLLVTFFFATAWLQIFTVPLLGSSFNVYFYGSPQSGNFYWLATQGPIWSVIGLYALLLISSILLFLWLHRQETGLRWDPTTLADIIVLLERSNALDYSSDDEMHQESGRLGYWRTNRAANTVFHTFGIAQRPARQYEVEDGRLREKRRAPAEEPRSHFSDPDVELGYEKKLYNDRMLRAGNAAAQGPAVLPWFLRPVFALLWPIIAIVLLVAFLVVSYLPSTAVLNGFAPDVSAISNKMGYSATNFLYSFVPSVLAMICVLGWLDIDYAYRRLQPYAVLLNDDGELAERSLLLSYTSDLPGIVSLSGLINGHLKIALFSFNTLVAAALPILAGGVFWTEFYVSLQESRITAQPSAYYALTVLLSLYAAAYLLVFPSANFRALDRALPPGNQAKRFGDVIALVRGSRILNDVAFYNPISKIDLVTRLLSSVPSASASAYAQRSNHPAATASKMSLADSVRGFGHARQHAREPAAVGVFTVPKYYLGRYDGRDGKSYVGLDRVRN